VNVRENFSHEQAMELLPWLVNDSLDESEKEAVLEHAHACVICRRELSSLQKIRDSVSDTSSTLPIPEPDMRRINAQIDEIIDGRKSWRGLIIRFRNLFNSRGRIAFAAQSVVLLALVMILVWPEPEDAQFETLTQTDSLPDGHYVRVVLSPDIQQSQLKDFLDQHELTIARGPSNRGVYTLGVASRTQNIDMLVSNLQGDPIVLFAQPVIIGAEQ
jgi:hypothetical protein